MEDENKALDIEGRLLEATVCQMKAIMCLRTELKGGLDENLCKEYQNFRVQ